MSAGLIGSIPLGLGGSQPSSAASYGSTVIVQGPQADQETAADSALTANIVAALEGPSEPLTLGSTSISGVSVNWAMIGVIVSVVALVIFLKK